MNNPRIGYLTAFSFVLALLTACQSGGSSSPANATPKGDLGPTPLVSLLSPSSGAKGVEQESSIRATFTEDIDAVTLTPATFQLYLGTSLANQIPGSVGYESSTRTAVFQPTQKLISGAKYTAIVSENITSISGAALGSQTSWTFETKDTAPPFIVSTNPACGTINAPVTSAFCVEFSEIVNPLTVLPGTILVNKQTATGLLPVSGSLQTSNEGKTLCFFPELSLDTDADYFFSVSQTIEDLGGNKLVVPITCKSTTIETVKPFVVEVAPAPSATKVKFDAVITVKLSEPVNSLTVAPDTLELLDDAGAKVDAAFQLDEEANALTLTPSTKLKVYSLYSVVLKPDIKDLVGNPFGPSPALAPPYTWTFQTVGWEAPTVIEHDDVFDLFGPPPAEIPSVGELQSAVDAKNAITWAVWSQKQESDLVKQIYVNSMPAGGNWGMTESAISAGAGDASVPQIAISPNGDPWVIWIQKDAADVKNNVYGSSFNAGAWSSPVRISSDEADAKSPRIAIDGAGIPFVAWLEPRAIEGVTGSPFDVVYASNLSGDPLAWNNKTLISATRDKVQSFDLGADTQRNRIYAVFAQKNTEAATPDPEVHCYVNIFEPGTGWAATATKISTDIQTGTGTQANDVSEPKIVAFPSTGNAIVAWIQKTTAAANSTRPYASFFTGPDAIVGTPGSWSEPVKLDSKNFQCAQLRAVGSSQSEQALVAWSQKDSGAAGTLDNFWSVNYTGTWGAQKRISDNKGSANELSLFWEPSSGVYYAAWTRSSLSAPTATNPDLASRIYSSSLPAITGDWDEGLAASAPPLNLQHPAFTPKISAVLLGATRRVVAIWAQTVNLPPFTNYTNLEGSFYEE